MDAAGPWAAILARTAGVEEDLRELQPARVAGHAVELHQPDFHNLMAGRDAKPAVLVCHWPGIYYNGEELGLEIFQEVVKRLHARFEHLRWMKLSEIARYWAAKELTRIDWTEQGLEIFAPFACPEFTVALPLELKQPPRVVSERQNPGPPLRRVAQPLHLEAGTFFVRANTAGAQSVLCFHLPKGKSRVEWART